MSDDAASVDLAWTGDHARVIYFTVTGRLVIQNIGSLERREIPVTLPLPPDDLWSIAASPDGRTLYYGAKRAEANIWRVEQPKAAAMDPRLCWRIAHQSSPPRAGGATASGIALAAMLHGTSGHPGTGIDKTMET